MQLIWIKHIAICTDNALVDNRIITLFALRAFIAYRFYQFQLGFNPNGM
jgi:hypothetical protein